MEDENFIINNINNIKSPYVKINVNYCEECDTKKTIIFNERSK